MSDSVNRLAELLKTIAALRQALDQIAERLQRGLDLPEGRLRELVKEQSARMRTLLQEQQAAIEEAQKIVSQLGSGETPPTSRPAHPEALARQFRTVIERIQLDARQPKTGDVGTTLKSLEVELKGLIVVEDDEARILTPSPGRAIDSGTLSTIKMSFGTIPLIPGREESPEQPG